MGDAYKYPDLNGGEISPTEAIRRLDIRTRAPRINWGRVFEEWSDVKKISHLKKFGESMNHAAALKQAEFVELMGIAERQERQLIQAHKDIKERTESYNQQLTHMNQVIQEMAAEIQDSQGPATKARRILKMGLNHDADSTMAKDYVPKAIEALSEGT